MKKNYVSLFHKLNRKEFQKPEQTNGSPSKLSSDPTFDSKVRKIVREEMKTNEQNHDDEMAQWKNFKIATGLSVPELSYFLRLLCETGIIKTDNISETVKFFITFFSSTHTHQISEGSFRKNFYTESATVSASVRDILYKLINQSKKGTK